MAFDADNNDNHSGIDAARFRKIAEDFMTHRGDTVVELAPPLREKLAEAVDDAPIEVIAVLADGWAKMQLREFMKLADVLASIRASAQSLDYCAPDETPPAPELAAVRALVHDPRYMEDPRINTGLDQFINRLGHVFVIDMRLGSFIPAYTKEPLIDLFLAYMDDVRDLARAAEPLVAWHTELKQALERSQTELN